MRSLNWKLSLSLLLIVAVSAGLMAFLTNQNTTSTFRQYMTSGNTIYSRSLAGDLGDLYEQTGSWNAVQESLEALNLSDSLRIVVNDTTGRIVGDSSGEWIGEITSGQDDESGTDIVASGTVVGTLYLLTEEAATPVMGRGRMAGQAGMTPSPAISPEDDFLNNFNDSLWKTALISAAVALLLGLILTRQITRPIKALIAGSRHLAKGNLAYRVRVSSKDEIGELAESFNTMASTLEKISKSRQQLTADIAHELRTPLTVIEGTVNGIIDGVFEADPEHLESIREQTGLLTHLIGDLRDISLAESGQLHLNPVSTDITELVRRVLTGHEPAALAKKIRLSENAGTDIGEIEIDPIRIEQVITNLLANAIRHTPPEGSVAAEIEKTENEVVITIADTGEGIDESDIPHIFERFFRPGTSRSRKEGGTGLGLAIVKQMVEVHGGSVSVESKKGEGSRFRVFLPLSQSDR